MSANIIDRRLRAPRAPLRRWHLLAWMGLAIACLLVAPQVRAQSHGSAHGGHAVGRAGGHGGDHGGGRGGGWHGGGPGWWGLGLGLGLGWGIAELADPYSYGYYGYPETYPYAQPVPYSQPYFAPQAVAPPMAPDPAVQPQAASWYYCDSARGYYPYIAQCPEAWRPVPATPGGPVR
jgi:hypothetical protein